YVRPLTDGERTQLEAERRGSDAFRVRRAQIVLASACGLSAKPIAQVVGCSVQTVRTVIHAFNTTGLAYVRKQSTRPIPALRSPCFSRSVGRLHKPQALSRRENVGGCPTPSTHYVVPTYQTVAA